MLGSIFKGFSNESQPLNIEETVFIKFNSIIKL